MDISELLTELYGRIPPLVQRCTAGVDLERLTTAPVPGANTIAWLVWHLSRVQDDHVADLLGVDQIWVVEDWAPRFGLAPDPENTGYGHTPEQVAAVRPVTRETLIDYFTVVHARTRGMLLTLKPPVLDRIVDRRWDPPVTMGVRLVSIADDCLQHLGQSAYLRGLLGA